MKLTHALLIALALTLVGGCDSPGEGSKANYGKAIGGKLIRALEAYKGAHGRYPDNLSELVPGQLREFPTGITENKFDVKFYFTATSSQEYKLVFSYTGPGLNTCTHISSRPEAGWKCSGAL